MTPLSTTFQGRRLESQAWGLDKPRKPWIIGPGCLEGLLKTGSLGEFRFDGGYVVLEIRNYAEVNAAESDGAGRGVPRRSRNPAAAHCSTRAARGCNNGLPERESANGVLNRTSAWAPRNAHETHGIAPADKEKIAQTGAEHGVRIPACAGSGCPSHCRPTDRHEGDNCGCRELEPVHRAARWS